MKNRFLLLIGILLLGLGLKAQDVSSGAKWLRQFEEAQAQAIAAEQVILMVFSGSDWCKPCMLLKHKILDHSDFVQYANRQLVLLEVDFPAKKKNKLAEEQALHNEALADRYNPKGQFPIMILMTADGHVMDRLSYHDQLSPADYIQLLERKITTSTNKTKIPAGGF